MKMESTTEALERLAIKQGAMLGNLSRPDLLLVLALAARCIPRSATLTEREVNAALKGWLAGTGAMLSVDHVELRRTLVDAGLWQRDGFGHAYKRPTSIATADVADAADALATLDAERIVATARTRRDAERAARKARATAS
jgi:hypothetical protein